MGLENRNRGLSLFDRFLSDGHHLQTPALPPRHAGEVSMVMKGKVCKECGNDTVIKKDGCDFCTACGAVGACG